MLSLLNLLGHDVFIRELFLLISNRIIHSYIYTSYRPKWYPNYCSRFNNNKFKNKWKKNKYVGVVVVVVFAPKLFQSRNFNTTRIIGTLDFSPLFAAPITRHVRKEWKLWSLRQPKTLVRRAMMPMIRKENGSKNKWKHIIQQIKSTTKSRVHILFFICHSRCATLCIKSTRSKSRTRAGLIHTLWV